MIDSLSMVDGASDQYGRIADNAKKLAEIEAIKRGDGEKENRKRERKIDPNTVLTVGGYIAGMVLIMLFESDGNVITTRALQFLPKPKM